MPRILRPFGLLTQMVGLSLGTTTAQISLEIAPPYIGAVVQVGNLAVKTAGEGAGIYRSIVLRGAGASNILAAAYNVPANTPVDTELAQLTGSGIRAKETDLEFAVDVRGPITSPPIVDVSVIWV